MEEKAESLENVAKLSGSFPLVQEADRECVQFRVLKGELDGFKGLLIPYNDLSRAFGVPEGFFMVQINDLGHEVQVVLCNKGAISTKGGLTRLVSPARMLKFIPKEEVMELLFWFCEEFSAHFLQCRPGWPLQIIEGDPVLILRNLDCLFVWFEEDEREPMEFKAVGEKR